MGGDDNDSGENGEEEDETASIIRRVLAAKDRGFISDEAYHELRMALSVELRDLFPALSQVKKERKEQNNLLEIQLISEVSLFPFFLISPISRFFV